MSPAVLEMMLQELEGLGQRNTLELRSRRAFRSIQQVEDLLDEDPRTWRLSLAEQQRVDAEGVGLAWNRRDGLGSMVALPEELLRAAFSWTDFRTRSAVHSSSKALYFLIKRRHSLSDVQGTSASLCESARCDEDCLERHTPSSFGGLERRCSLSIVELPRRGMDSARRQSSASPMPGCSNSASRTRHMSSLQRVRSAGVRALDSLHYKLDAQQAAFADPAHLGYIHGDVSNNGAFSSSNRSIASAPIIKAQLTATGGNVAGVQVHCAQGDRYGADQPIWVQGREPHHIKHEWPSRHAVVAHL
jgi:hypothetical protein